MSEQTNPRLVVEVDCADCGGSRQRGVWSFGGHGVTCHTCNGTGKQYIELAAYCAGVLELRIWKTVPRGQAVSGRLAGGGLFHLQSMDIHCGLCGATMEEGDDEVLA